MTDYPASLGVVLHVVDPLEVLGIRYHLGGSFASAVHGVPRQTMDRQWRDVLGVLAATGAAMDRAHLLRWAVELGVADLLERSIGEVERT
jgi:hypothetical protein